MPWNKFEMLHLRFDTARFVMYMFDEVSMKSKSILAHQSKGMNHEKPVCVAYVRAGGGGGGRGQEIIVRHWNRGIHVI